MKPTILKEGYRDFKEWTMTELCFYNSYRGNDYFFTGKQVISTR